MKDVVAVELWREVYLGQYLVELFCSGQMQKYKLAVDVAEIGEIHTPDVILILRNKY